MLHLRILAPNKLTDNVVQVLEEDPCVSGLAVIKSAAIHPPGDLVLADIAREAANDVIDRLRAIGVHRQGTIEIQPVSTWLSGKGFDCELKAPGSSRDAVVWAEVAQRSYEESELNWTYLSFMTLATVIASIAIILDSQVLVIGAMVLGPEFRCHCRARRCPGPAPVRPVWPRNPHTDLGLSGRHRRHNGPGPDWSRAGLDNS
jgi:hypothetical protein